MTLHCPECGSANVHQLLGDADQYICQKCGEIFEADEFDEETDEPYEEED